MTKQAEIQREVVEYICGICMLCGEATNSRCEHKVMPCIYARLKADEILSCLHSQGVVLKVERELPFDDIHKTCMAEVNALNILKAAGYVATESLIKEEK